MKNRHGIKQSRRRMYFEEASRRRRENIPVNSILPIDTKINRRAMAKKIREHGGLYLDPSTGIYFADYRSAILESHPVHPRGVIRPSSSHPYR